MNETRRVRKKRIQSQCSTISNNNTTTKNAHSHTTPTRHVKHERSTNEWLASRVVWDRSSTTRVRDRNKRTIPLEAFRQSHLAVCHGRLMDKERMDKKKKHTHTRPPAAGLGKIRTGNVPFVRSPPDRDSCFYENRALRSSLPAETTGTEWRFRKSSLEPSSGF